MSAKHHGRGSTPPSNPAGPATANEQAAGPAAIQRLPCHAAAAAVGKGGSNPNGRLLFVQQVSSAAASRFVSNQDALVYQIPNIA